MSSVKKVGKKKNKAKGVLGRIAPVSLSKSGITMLAYGKSGTGKTTAACTFPKPVLLIGANEDGTRSVHDVEGVDYVPLLETQEITELAGGLRAGKTSETMPGVTYKTVCLDEATSFQDMDLKEILGLEELPAQKNWGMASRSQYGQCAMQVKSYLRELLNLKDICNVVILAQERVFNTEEEQDTLLMPFVAAALTPSVVGWLNPACDYICQTFIRQEEIVTKTKVGKKIIKTRKKGKGVEYCLRTAPHSTFTTKFRLPKGSYLPDVLVDPDFEKIEALIQGRTKK